MQKDSVPACSHSQLEAKSSSKGGQASPGLMQTRAGLVHKRGQAREEVRRAGTPKGQAREKVQLAGGPEGSGQPRPGKQHSVLELQGGQVRSGCRKKAVKPRRRSGQARPYLGMEPL